MGKLDFVSVLIQAGLTHGAEKTVFMTHFVDIVRSQNQSNELVLLVDI